MHHRDIQGRDDSGRFRSNDIAVFICFIHNDNFFSSFRVVIDLVHFPKDLRQHGLLYNIHGGNLLQVFLVRV